MAPVAFSSSNNDESLHHPVADKEVAWHGQVREYTSGSEECVGFWTCRVHLVASLLYSFPPTIWRFWISCWLFSLPCERGRGRGPLDDRPVAPLPLFSSFINNKFYISLFFFIFPFFSNAGEAGTSAWIDRHIKCGAGLRSQYGDHRLSCRVRLVLFFRLLFQISCEKKRWKDGGGNL